MKTGSIKSTTKFSPYPSPNHNNNNIASNNKSQSPSPNTSSIPKQQSHNFPSHSPNLKKNDFAQSLSTSNFLNQSPKTFKNKISQILMNHDRNLISSSSKNLEASLKTIDFLNLTDPSTTRNIHAVQIDKEFTPRDKVDKSKQTPTKSIPSPSAKLVPFQRIPSSSLNNSMKKRNEDNSHGRKSTKPSNTCTKQKKNKLSSTSLTSLNPNDTSINSAKAMLSQLQQLSTKTYGIVSNTTSAQNLNIQQLSRVNKPIIIQKPQHQRKNNKIFYSQLSPQPSLQRTIKRSSSSSKSKKIARNNSLTSTTKKKKKKNYQLICSNNNNNNNQNQQTKHHTQPKIPQINLNQGIFQKNLPYHRGVQSAYHAYAPLADLTNNSAIDIDYSLQRNGYSQDDQKYFNNSSSTINNTCNTKFYQRNFDFQNSTNNTDLRNSLFQYRCPSSRGENKHSASKYDNEQQFLNLSNNKAKSVISPNFRLQTSSSKKLEPPFHISTLSSTSSSHRLDSNRQNNNLTLDEILTGLGIASYYSQFKKQSIELEDFFLLTRQDLKELGLPISARNRVLAFLSFFSKSSNRNIDLRELNGEKSLLEAILKENFSDKLVNIITSSVGKDSCNSSNSCSRSNLSMVKSQRTPYKESNNRVPQKYNFTQYKKLYSKNDQEDLRPLNAPPQQESMQDLRGQLESPQQILFKQQQQQQQQARCSNGLDQYNSQTLDLSQYSQKGMNRSKRNLNIPDKILQTQQREEQSINHQQQHNYLINDIQSQYNLTTRSKISDQAKQLEEMTADFRKKGSLSPTSYQEICKSNSRAQNKMGQENNTFTTGVSTNRSNAGISSMRLNYRQQQQQQQQNFANDGLLTPHNQHQQQSQSTNKINNLSQVINMNCNNNLSRSVNLTPQPRASSDQKSSIYNDDDQYQINVDIQDFMSRNPRLQQLFKKQQSKTLSNTNTIFKKNKYFNFGNSNKHLSSKYNRLSNKRKQMSTSSENLAPSPNSSFISKISRVSTPTTTTNCTMFNSSSAMKQQQQQQQQLNLYKRQSSDDLNTSTQMRNKLKKDRNQMNMEVKEIMAELQALSKPANDKTKIKRF